MLKNLVTDILVLSPVQRFGVFLTLDPPNLRAMIDAIENETTSCLGNPSAALTSPEAIGSMSGEFLSLRNFRNVAEGVVMLRDQGSLFTDEDITMLTPA